MMDRRLLVAFIVVAATAQWPGVAAAQTPALGVGQVYPKSGRWPMSKDTLLQFCSDAKFGITNLQIDDNDMAIPTDHFSSFMVKYDGSLLASLSPDWSSVWVVYSINGGATYRRFSANAITQPINIPGGPVEKEDSTYWVKGGLRAMGAPAAAMLMLLSKEATSASAMCNDTINLAKTEKRPLTAGEYLQASSYLASMIENLSLELVDGNHEMDQLAERLAAAKAREAALREVGANEQKSPFFAKYTDANAEVSRIEKLNAKLKSIIKVAADQKAVLEQYRGTILALFNDKRTESVQRNIKELVADTVSSSAPVPPPIAKTSK